MKSSILSHIEPLAVGVNMCQGSGTRPDHVIFIFAWLRRYYSRLLAEDEARHRPVIKTIESIDKRWATVDHEVFILAMCLNPYVKRRLFASSMTPQHLVKMLKAQYCRVFKVNDMITPPSLVQDFLAYLNETGEIFGNGNWSHTSLDELVQVLFNN
jgi:hypothetical protein